MNSHTLHHISPRTFPVAVLAVALTACGPAPRQSANCLDDLNPTLGDRPIPRAVMLVKSCTDSVRLRGYATLAILVPTDTVFEVNKNVLFLDGLAVPGLSATLLGPARILWRVAQSPDTLENAMDSTAVATFRVMEFSLRRNEFSREVWGRLLGGQTNLESNVVLSVGVGPTNGPEFARWSGDPVTIVFRNHATKYSWVLFWVLFIILALALIRVLPKARERRGSSYAEGASSLSRVVMVVWFFLVLAAFVLIWAITGDYNGVITGQALVLMGIQAGTVAGAGAAESTRWSQRRAGNRSGPSPGYYRGFWRDLLKDGSGQLAVHRLQSLAWHVILGVIFIVHAWENLWMPEFDETLLVLLGIGNGVYLGGKLVEDPKRLVKKLVPQPSSNAAASA